MTFNLILIRLDNLEGDNEQGMKKNNTLCSLQTVDFSLFSLTITLTCILVKLTNQWNPMLISITDYYMKMYTSDVLSLCKHI